MPVVDAASKEPDWTRVAGAAGAVGFALAVIGSGVIGAFEDSSLFQFPGTGSSTAEFGAFAAAHRSLGLAAMVLNSLAVGLWLLFGAGVWLKLREGGESFLSACFALGVAGFVTLIFAGFVPFFVLTYRAGDVADPRLLYDLTFGMLAMSGVPTTVALGAYAALVLRTGRLPRWTAWLAAIGACAHVLLLASFLVTDGFFSLEGQVITAIPATLFIWILGTSVAMLRGSG
jgi:hypothetical protein